MALPFVPTGYLEVTVPRGTPMMSGYVGKNAMGNYEGAVQHLIEGNQKNVVYGPMKKF